MANPEQHHGDRDSARPEHLRFMKQIRAEADLLRAVAQEADIQVAAIVATARRKRERLRSAGYGSRSTERAHEPGEHR